MTEFRLQYEADRLASQHTKQSLRTQLTYPTRSKTPLPRERFSPLTRCGRSRASAMESANDWIVVLRNYRLLPSNFFTLSASISIPSTHRALIAAIFAPVFGSVPIAND